MNTLFAGGGFKSASALLRSEKPIGSRMFYSRTSRTMTALSSTRRFSRW